MSPRRSASERSSRIWRSNGRAVLSSAVCNCSMRSRSAILATHSRPQVFKSAELQLLHCSFAPADFFGHLARAFLLDEAQLDHAALILGQFPHEREHLGEILSFLLTGFLGFG